MREMIEKSNTSSALQVILPIVYILIGLVSTIGNLNGLQIICSNRFRHKSIHLLIVSLNIEDLLFSVVFMIIRSVSYAHLNTKWFINQQDWCKAEMYLLRVFDFVLAYSLVVMCLTRLFKYNSFCCNLRSLRTGFALVASVWLASAYILIPILFFKQNLIEQQYGGYLCSTIDSSVSFEWLSATPRATLDIIDIIFRLIFPSFLMILILVVYLIRRRNRSDIVSVGSEKHIKIIESTTRANFTRMVLAYVFVFLVCQLPYEIYRFIMIQNDDLRRNLISNNLEFAVEIPLLILKLLNRAINPFLYVWFVDKERFSHKFCRAWCVSSDCWFKDCGQSIRNEFNYCLRGDDSSQDKRLYSTGIKSTTTESYYEGNTRVTKKIIVEEFEEMSGSGHKNDAFILN